MKKTIHRIDPLNDIGSRLLSVEKPARYLGGELGALPPSDDDSALQIGLCFPDLYEIGMSNNAIRILYAELNARMGLRCERVFAPAPDFEKLLAAMDLPLYTLESGVALCDLDILGLSLGYELAATTILAVLSSGKIPLERKNRGEGDPIVIMGGPAISNPHPFGRFVDACYIGEAEATFFDLMDALSLIKKNGGTRADLLKALAADGSVWFPIDSPYRQARESGSPALASVTKRAVAKDFSSTVYHTGMPVATLKAVQDHGTVEIMRGCPNGCRFCHAGYYYRPQRAKTVEAIREEVRELVELCGYTEITLASLSSGDFPGIGGLLDSLNGEWASRGVSFQLPSLKISSFNLPLLEKISEVRKSGLTFAVETPVDAWQRIINKDVSFEQTVSILTEAKATGFRLAKFYFMIGLPVPGGADAEADAIIEFFHRLHDSVSMQLNVNIGTFVPKAHTPFQWARQLTEEESLAAVRKIKDGLRRGAGIKVSYHSPFVSVLEGVISRGDERVGELVLDAFKKGARLDAWDENFDRELWKGVLAAASWDVLAENSRDREPGADLPWDDISIGVGKGYLRKEWEKARNEELTSGCMDNCTNPCGACQDEVGLSTNSGQAPVHVRSESPVATAVARLQFSFTKEGSARFLPHLAIVEAFMRAFQVSALPVLFSSGFNPMPRLELVQPLSIGISSRAEAASILLHESLVGGEGKKSLSSWIEAINAALPRGIRLTEAAEFPIVAGKKIHSLNGLSWGSRFSLSLPPGQDPGPERLAAAITARIEELAIQGALVSCGASSVEVLLPDPAKKEASLLRILEGILEARPVQASISIERLACLARAGERDAISYSEAFEILSS